MFQELRNTRFIRVLLVVLAIVMFLVVSIIFRARLDSSGTRKNKEMTPTMLRAEAATSAITLAWLPSPSATPIDTYRLHWGTQSRVYQWHQDVGNVTTTTVSGLGDLSEYFFTLSLRDVQGFESGYSNEVPFLPSVTPTPVPVLKFVKAINVNGAAEMIDGNPWLAGTAINGFSNATGQNYVSSIVYNPAVDAATGRMLNRGLWCPQCNLTFSQAVIPGNYFVYLRTTESYQANFRRYNVLLEGAQVATGIGGIPVNTWIRYGPYPASVSDGFLNVSMIRVAGDPVINGLEIWTGTSPSPTPGASPFNCYCLPTPTP